MKQIFIKREWFPLIWLFLRYLKPWALTKHKRQDTHRVRVNVPSRWRQVQTTVHITYFEIIILSGTNIVNKKATLYVYLFFKCI